MVYTVKIKTKIIIGIFISTMVLPLIVSNSESIFNDTTAEFTLAAAKPNAQVSDFYVAKTTTDELHLIYREKIVDHDQICYLEATNEYIWNHTKTIVVEENTTHILYSRPSITTKSDELFAVYGFSNDGITGINLLHRAANTKVWTSEIILDNIDGQLNDPIIAYDTNKSNFWLSWEDKHEGNFHQYCMIGNSTTMSWSAPINLSTNDLLASQHGTFTIDTEGNSHFVWKEGVEHHEKVLYRKVFANGTLTDIEEITDGTHSSLKPTIVLEGNDKINVFWNNHSVENPDTFRGTRFVSSSIKENGNWTKPFEVGPYIPPERPSSGESDAFTAAACFDKTTNKMWLAYEIQEDYAYHSGIDIRKREGSIWQPAIQLTLVNNLPKDPQLIPTSKGDIIGFWLDSRSLTNQVYFRIIFASGALTEEIILTSFSTSGFSSIWNYVLIALGAALILAIPSLIIRMVHKKRQEKYIKEKLKNLD